MSTPNAKEFLLGAATTVRGKINAFGVVIAFFLSIFVVNNYNKCTPENVNNNKYKGGLVSGSYVLAIIILILASLLFSIDIFNLVAPHLK
jgi:hypothetical protein